jgi:hypothetical protein
MFADGNSEEGGDTGRHGIAEPPEVLQINLRYGLRVINSSHQMGNRLPSALMYSIPSLPTFHSG